VSQNTIPDVNSLHEFIAASRHASIYHPLDC